MASSQALIAAFASTLIRVLAYVFLRWIPGHPFPRIIFALAAAYFISFAYCLLHETSYEIVAEEVDVKVSHPNGHANSSRVANRDSALESSSDDEVEVDVTQLLEKKDPEIFRTLLSGLPSPTSIAWSFATFAINLVLVALVARLTFQAAWYYPAHDLSFARIGYVSHHDVRILVREPNSTFYPLELSYRYADHPVSKDIGHRPFDLAWHAAGGISELTEATDYVTTFTIDSLKPNTRYQYVISNHIQGHFVTAPKPRSPLSDASQVTDDKFTFIHTSCIIPNFPFNPFAHPLSIPGFRYLAPWLAKIRPAFMLFLGDFIYIDVPHRHGSSVEDYRRAYRQVYASPDWPSVSKVEASSLGEDYDLPWLHVYDDHEIANDWSGNTTGVFPAAFDPYLHYHLSPGPPLAYTSSRLPSAANTQLTPDSLAHSTTPTWSIFNQGPASFFFMDTRRYRTPSDTSDPWATSQSLIGPGQRAALGQWLYTPALPGIQWKILVSSVPFTANWRVNAHDTWSGYRHERRLILEAMWIAQATQKTGIAVLSGDRHEFAATAFPPPKAWAEKNGFDRQQATVHEFSNSPLSMFYLPFRTYQEDNEISHRRSWIQWKSWLPNLLPRSQTTIAEVATDAFADVRPAEDVEHDVSLAYIPAGNSKFGIVDIESPTASGQSVLKYRAVVDGEEVWSHILLSGSKPVRSVLDESIWA